MWTSSSWSRFFDPEVLAVLLPRTLMGRNKAPGDAKRIFAALRKVDDGPEKTVSRRTAPGSSSLWRRGCSLLLAKLKHQPRGVPRSSILLLVFVLCMDFWGLIF